MTPQLIALNPSAVESERQLQLRDCAAQGDPAPAQRTRKSRTATGDAGRARNAKLEAAGSGCFNQRLIVAGRGAWPKSLAGSVAACGNSQRASPLPPPRHYRRVLQACWSRSAIGGTAVTALPPGADSGNRLLCGTAV